MSEGWKGGSTRAWRRIRTIVLKRDGYVCQLQIEGTCVHRADSVHHVLGKRHGDDPAHLLASCTPCNLKIGDPQRHDPEHEQHTRW